MVFGEQLILTINPCVESLPATQGPYQESGPLLCLTVHGSKCVCRYRKNFMGVGEWWPEGSSVPFQTKSIIAWADLEEFGRDLV